MYLSIAVAIKDQSEEGGLKKWEDDPCSTNRTRHSSSLYFLKPRLTSDDAL